MKIYLNLVENKRILNKNTKSAIFEKRVDVVLIGGASVTPLFSTDVIHQLELLLLLLYAITLKFTRCN